MSAAKEQPVCVMALTLSGKKAPLVQLFDNVQTAKGTGNGFSVYENVNKLAGEFRVVSVEDIFDCYNSIVPKNERWQSVNAISTRAEACWALWDAAIKYLPIQQKETTMAKVKEAAAPAKSAKGKAATKEEPKERKERVSDYEGKTLFASKGYDEMPPLREGSTRHDAMQPIISAGKKGIKFANWKGTTDNCTVSMLTKMIGWGRIEVR